MMRIKEGYFRPHPHPDNIQGCSGAKEFEGEDLEKESRDNYKRNLQKQWLQQQMEEKRLKEEQEKEEERLYAQQTLELNRMRGMLEDEYNQKRNDQKEQTKQTNIMLDEKFKNQTVSNRNSQLDYERQELETMKQRGQKRQFIINKSEYENSQVRNEIRSPEGNTLVYQWNYGSQKYIGQTIKLVFHANKKIQWSILEGPDANNFDTENNYDWSQSQQNVFTISWVTKANLSCSVSVNFNTNVIYGLYTNTFGEENQIEGHVLKIEKTKLF